MDPIPHLGNPEDQTLKEYIVTLKSMDDAEGFYKDMENPGGNLYIPDRQVECYNRRPISRNTHYMLTYDEAALIKEDPRVLTVELNYRDLGLVRGTFGFEQTSTHFDKRVGSDAADVNWGFLRCLRKTNISNWGVDGVVEQSASLLADCSGKNVDVVIMDDGCPYPTVYEYAQNPDGTGYSRMIEYNWFIHNPVVTGGAVGNYSYSSNRLQQHGGHTTGTTAGNTQGWARDANIYNITYTDSIDYVREFHKNKPINPLTGVKNPTVMNNSWGYRGGALNSSYISKFTIRGVDYFPTSGSNGSYVWDSNVLQNVARVNIGGAFPARDTATDVDMIDAMAEGVIIVASAGNSYFYEDVMGGLDYDNTMIYNGTTYYIHRGSSPGAADGGTEETKIICSGAMGQHNEATGASVYSSTGIETGDYKAEFSNYGPRIDCYAPGSAIQSIWSTGTTLYDSTNATDPRVTNLNGTDTVNNNFKKCPGTSMSSPQTTGVLACLAEKYPRMTQAEARAYIRAMCPETMQSSSGGAQDSKDAGFSYNANSNKRVLLLSGTRVPTLDVGGYHKVPFPEIAAAARPVTGQVIPRKRTLYSYNNKATFALTPSVNTVAQGQTVTINLATTNVSNGTVVPYLITAKPRTSGAPVLVESGFSGVYTTDTRVTNTDAFNSRPNQGNRITTTTPTAGSCVSITNTIIGPASLASSTPTAPGALTFTGGQDDGYWTVPLPFSVSFLNQTYSTIYVGTNTYITFGGGSSNYSQLSSSNPAFPKIMISANDNSCQRIYYGVEGIAPNRTFRIRWEGTSAISGTLGSPNMVYEAVFYENTTNQIDVHTGVNARWSSQSLGSVYPFDYTAVSVPLTGTVVVNSNTAQLPITISTSYSLTMNVRLGIFPAPNVDILIN
jgi:Subtilase family